MPVSISELTFLVCSMMIKIIINDDDDDDRTSKNTLRMALMRTPGTM